MFIKILPNFITDFKYKDFFLKPLFYAIVFCLPIYINIFVYMYDVHLPYLNALLVLCSIYVFINIDRKHCFLFGFFTSVMWFYWTGLSFRFTPVPYFMYLSITFIGLVYGTLFYILLYFNNKILRGVVLSLIGYVSIFDFDWFVPDSMLAFSAFRVDKITFIYIIAIIIIVSFKRLGNLRFVPLLLLFFCIDTSAHINNPTPKIKIIQTNTSQDIKWLNDDFSNQLNINISEIQKAIVEKSDIIILPETAFPIALNYPTYKNTLDELLNLSKDSIIVTGALRFDNGKLYNSTFIFINGKYTTIDKIILAPFGEYVPLPQFAKDLYYKISKTKLTTFHTQDIYPKSIFLKNNLFRNAICYEGVNELLFLNNPKFMILMSNNAWFDPSIEPVLQMTLLKYRARLHKTTIFHSANGSKSMIITPNMRLD